MLNVVFYNTSTLQKEEAHLETMFDGSGIMRDAITLTEWNTSLPNLINGNSMFQSCYTLAKFSGNLDSLQKADYMFINTRLSEFSIDLPSLVNAYYMFMNTTLKSFSSELPRLSNGNSMFTDCTSLTSFTSALPSLTDGINMFNGCKLDARSLMYIAETLPTVETPANITIGLGVNSEDEMEEFAKAASFNSWDELKQLFIDKNWTATFQYNGAPTATAATLAETGETSQRMIYVRLAEADEQSGEYISEETGKYYSIEWGHAVTNTSNHVLFGSLLEACGYFGVVPKEFAME